MIHEGRVLGALAVYRRAEERRFSEAEIEMLELLAGIAAAELVGIEAARREAELWGRMEGGMLAGRELSHVLNNTLTLPIGTFDLLAARADIPEDAREMLEAACTDLEAAEQHIVKFQKVVRVETKLTPIGPALDLERSVLTDSS